jgi:hypothetical protein
MRLSALYPPGRFLVLISVRGRVDPRAIARQEGLGQLKNPMNRIVHIIEICLPLCGTVGLSIKLSVVGMDCVGKKTDMLRNIYVNIAVVLCIHEAVLTDIWGNEIPKQALCMYGPQQQRIHY